MKARRNLLVAIVALMLILCCCIVLAACGSESNAHTDNVATTKEEFTNADNLDWSALQNTTTLQNSGSENSATTAASSSPTKTGIYIGGGEITSDRQSGGGWIYYFDSNTLLLNGYSSPTSLNNTLGLTKALFPDVKSQTSQAHIAIDSSVCTSLTIKVKGEYATYFGDIDDSDDYDKDNYNYYGIYAPGVDLTMDIEDDYAPMKYNPTYYPLQIYTHRDAVYCKSLTITGGGGLRADSCIGSGINCQDLTVNNSRLICYCQSANNIYHGIIGHTGAAILASGSVNFTGGTIYVTMENTAPKAGSIWAAYPIDIYGIKTGSLNIKGGANVKVNMQFSTDITQNVTFKATGIYAQNCTSYGGKVYTKIQTNDTMPDNASLYGCNIEDYTYFLSGNTTIEGEMLRGGSKSFKLNSNMQTFSLPFTSVSKNLGDTSYNYTANISALFLRNNNGTLQYASDVLFNAPTTLSSNEINMADFSTISTQNVFAVSGDWKIKPIADNSSSFVVLDDSITLEMSGTNTYDTLNLYTYSGATINLGGDGIINSLNATGCNDKGVEKYSSYGSVCFLSGTVKNGWINSSCTPLFYGGNINVDYTDISTSNPYHKWTFDFGEYADLVDFKSDIAFSSSAYDRTGLYPIDGKLYSWDTYQTTGTLFRLPKYAVVKPTDSYIYYLYPKAAEAERTFDMQRLAETDVFVANNIDSKYYLANGDTLTLDGGVFAKQVTRPATTFGGSSSTEILEGSKTATLPDGFTVKWIRTDKDKNTTQVGSGLSLSTQLKALDDDGSVYACTIIQGNTQVNKVETSIFVFDYKSTGLVSQKASADETISFSFSFDAFKGYDDWIADNYNFIWQIDKDGSGDFEDIEGTKNQNTLSVTITSDDSYKALYRVKCYSDEHYAIGSAMKSFPTFYTITANATFRELPSFNGGFSVSPADNYAGASQYYSISLENCYTNVVNVWYEYSTDDGQTWQHALSNPVFTNGVDIILQKTDLSPYGSQVIESWCTSKSLSVTLSMGMNGWKLRCVMQSGEYVVYSNETTLTVLNFAQFTTQPEETIIVTSSDSLTLSASFDEDYTDEDGNGISKIEYEWKYETWSNGSYESKDTTTITTPTLHFESASGIGSVSRYRLQVKFTYKEKEYTRYSNYAYVYVLYPPAFNDSGIVVKDFKDGIYSVGDSLSYEVKDKSVNFHLYKTYQFEISKDGGETWQNVGEEFTQSSESTTFAFGLQNLCVADAGLYRLKVSIVKNGVDVCSYSDAVNVGVISNTSINGNPQSFAVTNEGKLTLSLAHEYSSNLSATYQWQGYDSALGWIELTNESYFDVDKQSMYTFGASLPSYEKFRCLVSYKLNDGIVKDVYTNEVAPILIVKPEIVDLPADQIVWIGSSINFMLTIDNPTENYTVLWEISYDSGETWNSAIAIKQCESTTTDYSLLYNTSTLNMNGAMFRCTVTNAIGDASECIVTEPVTLTVKSGYVKSEQELLDALENGMTDFKLLDDITLNSTLLIKRSIKLDLNGHILSYQNEEASGSVIRIDNDATLTIYDSMPDSVHTDASLPLGGIISGGTGSTLGAKDSNTFGGAILIENGKLKFEGGTIYNCRATYGGGIHVSDSSYLSLEGGVIDNCSATQGGGIHSESDIDIADGNITNCTSSEDLENNNTSDAMYLNGSTLNATGGRIDGTVTLEDSSVVMPDGSVNTTEFSKTVYCDNSTIKGGFYLSDVVDADTTFTATVTYMNGDQVVTRLIVEIGQNAISLSLPSEDGKIAVWFNKDVAYNFNQQVTEDLVLSAKWYVTSDVADDLTDERDKTQEELDNTKSELDKTNATLDETKSELDKTKSDLDETKSELDQTKTDLSDTNKQLNETKSELDEAKSSLDETKSQLDETNAELDETKSELDNTKSELEETQNDVAQAQNTIDTLRGHLDSATEDIDKLNDELSSVTTWMIVSIVMFGLSCGAIISLLIIFYRKKKLGK